MKNIGIFHSLVWSYLIFLYSKLNKKKFLEISYKKYILYNSCIFFRNCYIFEITIYNLYYSFIQNNLNETILYFIIIFCKLEIYDSLSRFRNNKILNIIFYIILNFTPLKIIDYLLEKKESTFEIHIYRLMLVYLFTEKIESYFKYPENFMSIGKIKKYHECQSFNFWYIFVYYFCLI